MTPPQEKTLVTAQRLTAALEEMSSHLDDARKASEERDEALAKYGRRNRLLISTTALSILLDLALTLLLVFTYSTAHSAGQIAAAEHSNLLASCEVGNQFRAEQVTLWTHLAAVSKPPPHATRAQKAKDAQQIAALLRYIRKVFAPRDCARAFATSSPGR